MSLRSWIRRRCSENVIPRALIVERGGRPVARLSDPQAEDMFWLRWRVTPLVDDAAVTSSDFWSHEALAHTRFRCAQSKALAAAAFWACSDPLRGGGLVLRGAHVPREVSLRRQPLTWLRLLVCGAVV